MRLIPVLLVLLAGCSQPSPAVAPEMEPILDADEAVDWTRQTILEGAVQWHDTGSPLDAYAQVAQAVAHPCVWDGGNEVYFTNQPLGMARVPNGTKHLAIQLDWDATSYLRDALRVAHRAPSADRFTETAPFGAGEEMLIRVWPADYEDPATSWGDGVSLWACLDTDTGDGLVPPSIFRGELRFKVEAVA